MGGRSGDRIGVPAQPGRRRLRARSTEAQLDGTIERHFVGVDELMLLRLREDGLGDALRWEESRSGETYPHLYRAISSDEVTEVIPWRRRAEEGT